MPAGPHARDARAYMVWARVTLRPMRLVPTLIAGVACCLVIPYGISQTKPSSSAQEDQSWSATTESSLPDNVNPVSSSESHKESGNRTLDKQSLQRRGMDGQFEQYLDTEKQSVKVNDQTTRTVQKSFTADLEGRKKLVQVTEEERRTMPNGEVKVVRTTSNPDINGNLQVVQQEVEQSKQLSPTVKETRTTLLTPDVNGGLKASQQVNERQVQVGEHETKFNKSTQLSDGNGNWQTSEVRQGVITENGQDRTKDESVLRPGSDGKLALVEHTVSKEAEDASGQTRGTTETYGNNLNSPDALTLNQRVTTVSRDKNGRQVTETQVQDRSAADPSLGLQVTGKTTDTVRTADGKTKTTQTIQSRDAEGNMNVVSVDMTSTDKPPAVQVDMAPSAKPK